MADVAGATDKADKNDAARRQKMDARGFIIGFLSANQDFRIGFLS
jgi:hypothetical protein